MYETRHGTPWLAVGALTLLSACSGGSTSVRPRPGTWEGTTSSGENQSFRLSQSLEVFEFQFDWTVPCDVPTAASSSLGPISGAIGGGLLSFDRAPDSGLVIDGNAPGGVESSGISFSVRGVFSSATEVEGTTAIDVRRAPFLCDVQTELSWTAAWVGAEADDANDGYR